MKENNTFTNYIKPVIVLVVLCFVVTLALAYTYGVTHPIISKRAERDADRARAELLKEADGFDQYDGALAESEDGNAKVTECYNAKNGAGSVMTIETSSFGGKLTMMVGVDSNGSVTGVKVTDHQDTPGVGTKNFEEKYLDAYIGISDIHNENVKSDDQIDAISGASVTGQALHSGVSAALRQYEMIGGTVQ